MVNFNRIPYNDDEKTVIFQFDSDGKRAASVSTIEIPDVDEVLTELNSVIDEALKKGDNIYGIDFSNCDLMNDELAKVVDLLITKIKTISFLDLYQSQTNALDIENYTTSLPILMGYPEKPLKWLLEQDLIYEMPNTWCYLLKH